MLSSAVRSLQTFISGDQTTSPQTHGSTPEIQLHWPGLSSLLILKGEGTLLRERECVRAGQAGQMILEKSKGGNQAGTAII